MNQEKALVGAFSMIIHHRRLIVYSTNKKPVPGSILTVQCTTLQYITTLKVCCEALREIIDILSPIRADSVEGANGLKVLVGEGELDWFSHLHTQQGKKGGSCQQLTRGVQQRYPAC